MDTIKEMLPFLIPLLILQLGLMIFALVDVAKREKVRGGNKVVWILLIIFINLIGPVVYLAVGRLENTGDSD